MLAFAMRNTAAGPGSVGPPPVSGSTSSSLGRRAAADSRLAYAARAAPAMASVYGPGPPMNALVTSRRIAVRGRVGPSAPIASPGFGIDRDPSTTYSVPPSRELLVGQRTSVAFTIGAATAERSN